MSGKIAQDITKIVIGQIKWYQCRSIALQYRPSLYRCYASEGGLQGIVVFGSTGKQGNSVARALITDKKFTVRGVTRNFDTPKAKELEKLGASLVKADLDDKASLLPALDGAYGVFLVTNFWEHMDQAREIRQGKNLVDAAKEKGVKHVVFSGLENVKKAIGKDCPHFDGKAAIQDYMVAQKVPHSAIRLAYYAENFIDYAQALFPKMPDGRYLLKFPMANVPMDVISADDIGECVHQILAHPGEYMGKSIGLSCDKLSIDKYAAILSEQLKPLKFYYDPKAVTPKSFAELGFPGAADMAAMFEFYQIGNPERDVKLTKKLNPRVLSFKDWVAKNKDAFRKAYK